ncbi:CarD family transcriptional regulator [bacterium 1XD8-76]|nr:CarD family transcriptional regulator [bacterium 1XD8-76]
MFKVGDYVVYGNSGVCRIEEIGPLSIGSKDKDYYTLVPVYGRNSRLYTVVDSDKVVIRPIMTKQESDALIEEMESIDILRIGDEKNREEIYKEMMKSCDCKAWVQMIKTLYLRKMDRQAKGKKVTSSDERYLSMAQDNLYGELAFSLQMPKEKVGEFISERISKKRELINI